MSPSKNTSTSASVAATPVASASALLPSPRDTSTSAPAAAARRAVASVDWSSTTMTRRAPDAARAAVTTPAIVGASLRAGMMTSYVRMCV
jgi:hypothetical protein